jgi:hypothetical protein
VATERTPEYEFVTDTIRARNSSAAQLVPYKVKSCEPVGAPRDNTGK